MQIQFYDIISNQVLVLLADVLLTRTFGKEARWYQLHVFGNLMVISNIFNETYSLFKIQIFLPLCEEKLYEPQYSKLFIISSFKSLFHEYLCFEL